jgi:transcriptional regulator with XRE-family HTH domain
VGLTNATPGFNLDGGAMGPNNQPMVEIDKAEVARRIEGALYEPGKSVKEFAKSAGISVQAVYKWMKDGEITKENLLKLEAYTEKPHGYFLSKEKPFVRSPDEDLDEVVAMMERLWPPSEFGLPAKERNELARIILEKYPAAREAVKIINFIAKKMRRRN